MFPSRSTSRFIMLHNLWFKGISKLIFAFDETLLCLLLLLVYVLIINTRKGSRVVSLSLVRCPIVESCFKAFFNYYLIWMYQILAHTLFSELKIGFLHFCKLKVVQIYAFSIKCWPAFYWNICYMEQAFFNHRLCPGRRLSSSRLKRENFSCAECQSFFLGVARKPIAKTKCYLIIQTHKISFLPKRFNLWFPMIPLRVNFSLSLACYPRHFLFLGVSSWDPARSRPRYLRQKSSMEFIAVCQNWHH